MAPEEEDVSDFRHIEKKGSLAEDCHLGLAVHMQCSMVGASVSQTNPLRVSMAALAKFDRIRVGAQRGYLKALEAVYVGHDLGPTRSAKATMTPPKGETNVWKDRVCHAWVVSLFL